MVLAMSEEAVVANVILSIANAAMLAINLFLVNRRSKESLSLSQRQHRVRILEKSGLSTELSALRNKEEIKTTNIGELSIDKISLDVCVLTETQETLLERKYVRKDTILKGQEVTIPLHSILKDVLKGKGLVSYYENDLGVELDPDTGHEVPIVVGVWYAEKDFSLNIVIKTDYVVLGEIKTQQNTFKLEYMIDPEWYREPFAFIDSDNYRVNVQKISGEWQ